jgi:hypothetical protein
MKGVIRIPIGGDAGRRKTANKHMIRWHVHVCRSWTAGREDAGRDGTVDSGDWAAHGVQYVYPLVRPFDQPVSPLNLVRAFVFQPPCTLSLLTKVATLRQTRHTRHRSAGARTE